MKKNIDCPYCNKVVKIDFLKNEKESGFVCKWHVDCKNWILVGWDEISCLRCKKETDIKDDGKTHFWYCEECSKETLIDAISQISVNTREEIIKFVKYNKN